MSQKGVKELVQELKEKEVNVVVVKCDIADRSQVLEMVSECQETLPPIKGVIHGAMALRDILFEKMSFSDWNLNIRPRVHGAWNLHHCLAKIKLDFFVMLASSSAFSGNPGQTAYAASNTFLNAFAFYRKNLGLPACAIDIGLVQNVGYIVNNREREAEISLSTHDFLTEDEVLALVKAAITRELSDNEQTLTGFKLWPERPLPQWTSDPKFLHVVANLQSNAKSGAEDDRGIAVQHHLKQADSLESAVELICQALIKKIANLLAITTEDVDSKKPVVAYGLDSLVAVELRNWITVDLEASVPLMELMSSPSIEALAGKIAAKSRLVAESLSGKEKDR